MERDCFVKNKSTNAFRMEKIFYTKMAFNALASHNATRARGNAAKCQSIRLEILALSNQTNVSRHNTISFMQKVHGWGKF